MKLTALDVESEPITDTEKCPRLVVTALADDEGARLRRWDDPSNHLLEVLGGTVVGLNVAFDLAVIARWIPELEGAVWRAYAESRVIDIGVRQQLLDIAAGTFREEGYSLADLAKRHLGREMEKGADTWRLRYGELRQVPLDQWPRAAREYALNDAQTTLDVYRAQPESVIDEHNQCRSAFALYLMSVRGIAVDRARVDALARDLEQRSSAFRARITRAADQALLEGHDRVLYRWRGVKKEPKRKLVRNDSEIRRRVRAELGIGCPRTETGLVSTSEDTLAMCVGQPELLALAENAGAEKLRTAFLPYLQRAATQGTVHPRFDVLVYSGRCSCSKPNLQQLPKEGGVRECFCARPGYLLVSCDYTGAESATLAQVLLWMFGKSEIAKTLQAGRSLLLDFSSQLLGLSYEETERRYKAGDPEVKRARTFSKVPIYGLPGGLGPPTLVEYARTNYGLIITEGEAREYKKVYLRKYTEMVKYFDRIGETVDSAGKIVQFVSGRVRGGVTFTKAANGYFQGLASDMFKAALWRATVEGYTAPSSPFYGSRLLVGVHDEVVAEVPEARAHEAALRLSAVMVEEAKRYLPDIPIEAPPALMRNWSKDAEPRYVLGRLVPWDGPIGLREVG